MGTIPLPPELKDISSQMLGPTEFKKKHSFADCVYTIVVLVSGVVYSGIEL